MIATLVLVVTVGMAAAWILQRRPSRWIAVPLVVLALGAVLGRDAFPAAAALVMLAVGCGRSRPEPRFALAMIAGLVCFVGAILIGQTQPSAASALLLAALALVVGPVLLATPAAGPCTTA